MGKVKTREGYGFVKKLGWYPPWFCPPPLNLNSEHAPAYRYSVISIKPRHVRQVVSDPLGYMYMYTTEQNGFMSTKEGTTNKFFICP